MNLKWMKEWKSILGLTTYRASNRMKKAAVTVLLVSSFTFNIGFASDAEKEKLQEIFHVYAGDKYIGTISDDEVVYELIDAKSKAVKEKYKGLNYTEESNIKLVPEQKFNPQTDDDATLAAINDNIQILSEAYAVTVDNQVVAYVKDQAAYEEVLHQLKLSVISEQSLQALEARKQSNAPVPALEVGSERIIDLAFVEEVAGKTKNVLPSEVLTVENAVQYLRKGTLQEKVYEVQEGDVLGSIAVKFDIPSRELLALNPDLKDADSLQIGQQLKVTALKPFISVSLVTEIKISEVIQAPLEVIETDNLLKGTTKTHQTGVDGKRDVIYRVTEVNGIRVSKSTQSETILKEAIPEVILKGTKVIPSVGTGSYVWPAQGGYISSDMGYRWGEYHRGIDIAGPYGYAIYAIDNGRVSFTGWDGTYGNKIVINHNNGYTSTYAHLSDIDVSVGQTVGQGSVIGRMGSTGRSTGLHLHLEMTKNGALINPLPYIR